MYWWWNLYRSTLPIAEQNQSMISIAITGYLKPSYALGRRTRKARSQKLPPTKAQPDIKALHNPEIKIRYVEAINNRLTNNINQQVRPIDIVNSVAIEILSPTSKKNRSKTMEEWRRTKPTDRRTF